MPIKEAAHIESAIIVARGHRVILASDLAGIYRVETRVLNQAVKRNSEKFPDDFMFRLTRKEAEGLLRSRSQSVMLKRGENIKHLPYVFTEHGAIMAAQETFWGSYAGHFQDPDDHVWDIAWNPEMKIDEEFASGQ